jgi:hypothetical protein
MNVNVKKLELKKDENLKWQMAQLKGQKDRFLVFKYPFISYHFNRFV